MCSRALVTTAIGEEVSAASSAGRTAGTSVCLLPRRATSAFLCVGGACWERNSNYRLLLADEGQRCLRCAVEHRKRGMKP